MDKVLFFITPGPLTERFRFSIRVLISWLTSYSFIGLGFAMWLASIPTATKSVITSGSYATTAFAFALAMCIYALASVGIDGYLGRNPAHYGWYWWVYPIISCAWTPLIIIGLMLGMASKSSPSPPSPSDRRPPINPNQTSGSVIDEHLPNLNQLIEKPDNRTSSGLLSMRKRILIKLQQNPSALLEDILTNDEMEELVRMIIETLS